MRIGRPSEEHPVAEHGSCDLRSRMCDMLFAATSYPLAEFIFFLGTIVNN
ncbi:hypothetical protein N665_0117s0025 [Sinapis alba]|nr:hypothetical protein N665_0117s0025 [Sinapis alba]